MFDISLPSRSRCWLRLYGSRNFDSPRRTPSLLVALGRLQVIFVAPRWEPRDVWIGVYHERQYSIDGSSPVFERRFYVCLIPCFVVKVIVEIGRKLGKKRPTH